MPCLSELIIDCVICGSQQKCSKVNLSEVNSNWPRYFCELLGMDDEGLRDTLPEGFYCPQCYSKIRSVATVSDLMEKMACNLKEMKSKLEDEFYLGNIHLTTFSEDDPETVEKLQSKLRLELFKAYEKKLEKEKQAAMPAIVEIPKTTSDEGTQCLIVSELTPDKSQVQGATEAASTRPTSANKSPVNKLEKTTGERKKRLVTLRLPRTMTKQVLDSLIAQSETNNGHNQLVLQGFVERGGPTTVEGNDTTANDVIDLEGQNGLAVVTMPNEKNPRISRKRNEPSPIELPSPPILSHNCPQCDKVFNAPRYLKRHLKQQHSANLNGDSSLIHQETNVKHESKSQIKVESNSQVDAAVAMELNATTEVLLKTMASPAPPSKVENSLSSSAKKIKLTKTDGSEKRKSKSNKEDKEKSSKKKRRGDKQEKSDIVTVASAETQTAAKEMTKTMEKEDKNIDSNGRIEGNVELMTVSPLKTALNLNQQFDEEIISPYNGIPIDSGVGLRKSTRLQKTK